MTLATATYRWTGNRYTPGSGSAQTWTFPLGVYRVWIALWGGGVDAFESNDNRTIYARIDGTPGETLQINCGGSNRYDLTWSSTPVTVAGGWNGGGTGHHSPGGGSGILESGAGATDIRRGPFGLADRILVAGGAGGTVGGAALGGPVNEYVLQSDLVPAVSEPTRAPRPTPTVDGGGVNPIVATIVAPTAGGTATGADGNPTVPHSAAGGGGAGGGASGGVYESSSGSYWSELGRAGGFYAHPGCPLVLPPGLTDIGDHPAITDMGADLWGGAARLWWQPATPGWSLGAVQI